MQWMMTVTGLWFTTDKELWVLKERTRTEYPARWVFEATILSTSKGFFPSQDDIQGLYLIPKLPQVNRPILLRILSVSRSGRLITVEDQIALLKDGLYVSNVSVQGSQCVVLPKVTYV